MKVKTTLNTNGSGLWSDVKREVSIHNINIGYVDFDEDGYYGELQVFFTKKSWDVDIHGLIYTDPKFLVGLRKFLNSLGLKGSDVDYTEQGMQGDNYVSIGFNDKFWKSWKKVSNK